METSEARYKARQLWQTWDPSSEQVGTRDPWSKWLVQLAEAQALVLMRDLSQYI